MSFYTEYYNITAGTPGTQVTSMAEFLAAPTDSKFKRIDGKVFIKTSAGYFNLLTIDSADESIDSTKFVNAQSLVIKDSTGAVIKTIFGAGE